MGRLVTALSFGLIALAATGRARCADCNRNGLDDGDDIASGRSPDCNANGVPDECDLGLFSLDFDAPRSYAIGARPLSILAADLDGDGDVDLATVNHGSGDVSVLLNEGDGRFAQSRNIPAGETPTSLSACDLDHDGDLDLVVGHYQGVSVLWNRRDGGFSPAENVAPQLHTAFLTVGDMDGDGRQDIVVVDFDAELLLLSGRDGGALDPPRELASGSFIAVAAADIDGDGDLDLAALGRNVSLLRNDGQGTFALLPGYPACRAPDSLSFHDLNGDGRPDMVVVFFGDELPPNVVEAGISVYLNQGGGAFSEPSTRYYPGSTAVTAADLDGDGRPDLLVSGMGVGLRLLLNQGEAGFREVDGPPALASVDALAAADLDGDGHLDLALAQGAAGVTGEVLVLKGRGGADFIEPAFSPSSSVLWTAAAADLDGDGKVDLAGSGGRAVFTFRNHGDASLEAAVEYPTGDDVTALVMGDFNGDGNLELATSNYGSGSLSILLNQGNGLLEAALDIPVGEGPGAMVAADLDGDGRTDLAVAVSGLKAVSVFLNPADPGARTRIDLPFESYHLSSGDLDGDGRIDLITAGPDPAILLHLNQGQGRFAPARGLTAPGPVSALLVADLDADREPDLVATVSGSDRGLLFWNRGQALFEPGESLGPLPDSRSLVAADLNGDAVLDLSFVGFSDILTTFLGRGDGSFKPGGDFAVPGSLALVAGDFNEDGRLDLALPAGEGLAVVFNTSASVPESDLNRNGVPDACEGIPFHRGDPSGDGLLDISDAIGILGFLFTGLRPPACLESADANDDGEIDLSDAIFLLKDLFLGGAAPPHPGPPGGPCGHDRDPPGAPGHLGCESYSGC